MDVDELDDSEIGEIAGQIADEVPSQETVFIA
jgi:hypothetical protein